MLDMVFSFDTTGSMYPAIAEVRRRVSETVSSLFGSIPALRIGLIAHGDFIDEKRGPYVTTHLPLTDDRAALIRFAETVERTNGGDGPECYEKVLYEARGFNWREGAEKILVMIGDASPHVRGQRTGDGYYTSWDWREEARALAAEGVTIHAVHCLRQRNGTWWEELPRIANGVYLTLAQFSHINEMIGAVAHHANSSLDEYTAELGALGLNRHIAEMLRQLRGETAPVSAAHRSGLVPVPPARFQVLHVDKDSVIRDFVESSGAVFRPGRGFYQFTKTEEVQPRKEVILVDRESGDMFSGSEARELLGLPYGTRGKVNPRGTATRGYDVYIQSTSYNRKLVGGTKFLYEAFD